MHPPNQDLKRLVSLPSSPISLALLLALTLEILAAGYLLILVSRAMSYRGAGATARAADEWINILIAAAVLRILLFLVWFYRAHRNLKLVFVSGLSYSPGLVLFFFLVPVLNLFFPYLIAREIWKASAGEADLVDRTSWKRERAPSLIGYWWILHLAALATGYGFGAILQTTLHVLDAAFLSFLLSAVFLVAAADFVATLLLVVRIDRQQSSKAGALLDLANRRRPSWGTAPGPRAPVPQTPTAVHPPGPAIGSRAAPASPGARPAVAPRPAAAPPAGAVRAPLQFPEYQAAQARELSPTNGCVVVFAMLALPIALAIFLALLPGSIGEGTMNAILLLVTPLLGAFAGAVVVSIRNLPLSRIAPFRRVSRAQLVPTLPLGLGLALIASSLSVQLARWISVDDYAAYMERFFSSAEAVLGPGLVVLALVVLAPLCEEMVFRGLVFDAFLSRWSPILVVISTAALFALLHLHPIHMAVTFLLGLVCGTARHLSDSIWPPILVHAAYNLTLVALEKMLAQADALPPGLGALGILITVAGLLLLPRNPAARPSAAALTRSAAPAAGRPPRPGGRAPGQRGASSPNS